MIPQKYHRKSVTYSTLIILRPYIDRRTEMTHQRRVSRSLSHAVIERAVGELRQRLQLAFVLEEDILTEFIFINCQTMTSEFYKVV